MLVVITPPRRLEDHDSKNNSNKKHLNLKDISFMNDFLWYRVQMIVSEPGFTGLFPTDSTF